jgi:hypothetical protein
MRFLSLLFFLAPCTVSWALPSSYPCGIGPWIDVVACQDRYRLVEIDTQIGMIDLVIPLARGRGETISTRINFTPAGSTEDAKRKNQAQFDAGFFDFLGFGDRIPASSKVAVWKVARWSSSMGSVCFDDASRAPRHFFQEESRDDCENFTKTFNPIFEILPLPPERSFQAEPLHLASMPLRIAGSFSGDLSNTSVQIGDQPAIILAESEAEILVASPSDLGLHRLVVSEGGKEVLRTYVRFLGMDLTPGMVPKLGETLPVTLTLTGLTNLTDSIRVSLTASSFAFQSARISEFVAGCGSVSSHTSGLLRRAQRITLTIPPRDCAGADGTYVARFRATGTKDRHLPTALGEVSPRGALIPAPTAFDVQVSVPLTDDNRTRTVDDSIRRWSADNAIPVSAEAIKAIQTQFAENRGLIEEFWGSFESQVPDESVFVDGLVRYYLYDLRDKHRSETNVLPTPQLVRSRFLSNQDDSSTQAIDEKTVGGRLLKAALIAWWRISEQQATLEIDSDPPHLRISWTGGGGVPDRDETNRMWHFPPGSYTISVGPNPDLNFKFNPQCPGPHGTVACSNNSCPTATIIERCEEWVRATQSLKTN